VSEYTKQTVQDYLGIPDEKITVIHNGVSPEFHSIPDFAHTIGAQTLRSELKISPETRIILYVGSDHPRKNVITAVRAFAKAQKTVAKPLIFLKVGVPGLPAGREALLAEIERLNIRDSVRFLESVTIERLNELYNLASAFIYPSRYEGFGLPVLEAMAAGTPVVTTNTTALPEIAGSAAVMHDPDDVDAFADSLTRILTEDTLAATLKQLGLARAREFSWETAAEKTHHVYAHTLS
jgi:glycosyltransferase involved in cell wall biosynthesis